MVLEWLKGATGVFSAGDRGAARSPAQARPPARRVRIQEDAKAAAAARVTREKEKARKDTPRKKNQGGGMCAARQNAPGSAPSTAVGYYARPRPSLLPTTRAPGGLR